MIRPEEIGRADDLTFGLEGTSEARMTLLPCNAVSRALVGALLALDTPVLVTNRPEARMTGAVADGTLENPLPDRVAATRRTLTGTVDVTETETDADGTTHVADAVTRPVTDRCVAIVASTIDPEAIAREYLALEPSFDRCGRTEPVNVRHRAYVRPKFAHTFLAADGPLEDLAWCDAVAEEFPNARPQIRHMPAWDDDLVLLYADNQDPTARRVVERQTNAIRRLIGLPPSRDARLTTTVVEYPMHIGELMRMLKSSRWYRENVG